jgi:hypothetical protein
MVVTVCLSELQQHTTTDVSGEQRRGTRTGKATHLLLLLLPHELEVLALEHVAEGISHAAHVVLGVL